MSVVILASVPMTEVSMLNQRPSRHQCPFFSKDSILVIIHIISSITESPPSLAMSISASVCSSIALIFT